MITFITQSLQNFQMTGSLMPSSPWLARALVRPLLQRAASSEPLSILEAGPGTGALTVEIAKHLKSRDHLTLCEINACFVRHLEDRLANDPVLAPFRNQITIHHGPVEELNACDRFDHIVSGLPFNNFPPALVKKIFNAFFQAARPGGTISFFEYIGIRKLKAPFLSDEERASLDEVETILEGLMAEGERKMTLLNVPPAWACELRVSEAAAVGESAAV